MDAAGEFLLQQRIDRPVALDAAHRRKCFGDDADAEMRLAGAVIGFVMAAILVMVPRVKMAFVNHFKAFGAKAVVSSLPSRFVCYCEWTFGPLLPI